MKTVTAEVVGYDYDEFDRSCWHLRLPSYPDVVKAQNENFAVDGRALIGRSITGVLSVAYADVKRSDERKSSFTATGLTSPLSPSETVVRGEVSACERERPVPYYLLAGPVPVYVDVDRDLPGGPLAVGEWVEVSGVLAFDPEAGSDTYSEDRLG